MAKTNEFEAPAINIIGNGTTLKGDIKSDGDFRIDGTLIGSISSKAKVIIGATGIVEGEIKCNNGDFSGTIKANVHVTEMLALKATSKLAGNIHVGKLSIEPGAQFSGNCKMENADQNSNQPVVE
jgi:cytoskeletal protein CcmA (bactofilin family)